MDEAEILCDQIAIMINGGIVVYGTPGYLMQTYGQAYILIAKVNLQRMSAENAKQNIATLIPKATF